jgi:hypothetical protein
VRDCEILGNIAIVCTLLSPLIGWVAGWNRSFAFGNDTPFAFPFDGLMCYAM